MADWWNTSYSIRRNIRFAPQVDIPIDAGHPLTVGFNYNVLTSANKVRPDFTDIEVLYLTQLDTWQVIPHYTYIQGETLYVQFNAVEDIDVVNTQYYIYMRNFALANLPVVEPYVDADYAIDTSETSGIGLSFTKPTEEWVDGKSLVANAKANFSLFGIKARLVVQKGPDRGILEVKVDDGAPFLIDTYAPIYSTPVVYTTSGLTLGRHNIRMRVTGDKNKSSSGIAVKIVKFEYSKYVLGTDLGEEINSELTALRIVVGP